MNINGVCTTPSPAPVATISVTPSSCTIAAGDSKTTVNVSYATSNATTVKLVNGLGTTLATAPSAGVNVDAVLGSNDYQVTATGSGGTVVQNAKATCTCAAGSVANGAVCAAVDSTGPVLSLRASTPAFTTAANAVSATIIIDSNEALGTDPSGIPLGTMAVRDSASATASIAVNFVDAAHKAVQLVASGLSYGKAYTATFALRDLSGNTTTVVVPFTTPSATPAVLHYSNVIVGVRYGRPGIVSATGNAWTEATNRTSYQFGVIPIYNAMVSEAPQPDGTFLELVQAAVDGDLHIVSHNVVTNVVTDFTGTVPAGYEVTRTGPTAWNIGPKWHGAGWGTAPYAYMWTWGQDSAGGIAYTDSIDGRILRYRNPAGALSVLYTSSDGGAFTVLIGISN